MKSWNRHYTNEKSRLLFPDENLVRLLKEYLQKSAVSSHCAVDIGCGSGRHSHLLALLGIENIVATDISLEGLGLTRDLSENFQLVQSDTRNFPFKKDVFDLAVAWGSLHYTDRAGTEKQIDEIHRSLKSGGTLFGTLRSERDSFFTREKLISPNTYIARTGDLEPTEVSFYSQHDLKELFKAYTSFSSGLMERTRLDDEGIISHFYFRAVK